MDAVDRHRGASYGRNVHVVRRLTLAGVALAAAVLAAAGAADVSASNAIRPAPGTPDPKAMVLTSADLGRAKVTFQRYYKDRDFPSVISYERELEDGRSGATPLLLVNTEAEIGVSVATTAKFLRQLRLVLSTKEGRALVTALIQEELGGDEAFAGIKLGRTKGLGVGPDSFDLPMTLKFLGIRADVHVAAFRVGQVLGLIMVLGEPERRVPPAVMTRLAKIMAGRMQAQLVPKNTALPTISGSPVAGETLTASKGTWSGSASSFAFQWQRCNSAGAGCTSIPGATGQTYVVVEADLGSTLRVSVTARNTVGSASATSAPTSVVSGFVDTFTGDRVNPFWSLGTTGNGPTIAQANGQLEVTFAAGTSVGSAGYANAFAFMRCRIQGDFDMQVDYRLLSGLLPTDGIHVGFDAAEFTGETYSGQHGMFISKDRGPQGISTHFGEVNDFVQDTSLWGTLRLVRRTTGGVTTMTASRLNGPSWSFTSPPYTAPTSQAANLNVFTSLTPLTAEVRVAYDNFRINSGTITCP
jgi:hypothetical protein